MCHCTNARAHLWSDNLTKHTVAWTDDVVGSRFVVAAYVSRLAHHSIMGVNPSKLLSLGLVSTDLLHNHLTLAGKHLINTGACTCY